MQEIQGNLVDVIRGGYYPARITFSHLIEQIEKTKEKYNNYILPGFIDGHIHVVADNEITGLELPLAGLMSSKPAQWVRDKFITAARKLTEIGCGLASPFMTISFLALPVIPDLKITDKGLFNVKKFRSVDVIKSNNE